MAGTDHGRERGVSDVLGFVFVFSLIVLTTGTVVVFGVSGLQDVRAVEQVSNAERAFDVLAENVDDIAVGDAPGRATEIRLANARLGFDEATRITVKADGKVVGRGTGQVSTTALTYTTDDAQLVYEGGAVFRTERGGSATVRAPPIVATRERTVVPLVEVTGSGPQRGGSGVVLVRADRDHRDAAVDRSLSNVTIEVETDPRRVGAWKRTLDDLTPTTCTVADATVRCTYPTDVVVVTETGVTVTYEN